MVDERGIQQYSNIRYVDKGMMDEEAIAGLEA